MKYLITGSSGFIGGHLQNKLKELGHSVIGLDLQDHTGDIRDYEDLVRKMDGAEGVFHLAAIASVQTSIADPEGTALTNAQGTRNVLNAARSLGGLPVAYASSAAVYGDNQNLPLRESETPNPLSPYAEHKLQNERDAQDSGLKTFGLRFFNVYGPGQDPSSPYSGVISIFHDRLKSGKPIMIYGDGQQTRDFVAVDDAVRALTLGMDHALPDSPVANVCTGHSSSLQGLLSTLGGVLDIKPEVQFEAARPGDIRHSSGNAALLEKLTGFKPTIPLKDGLKKLAAT